jgi:hypothetical protein
MESGKEMFMVVMDASRKVDISLFWQFLPKQSTQAQKSPTAWTVGLFVWVSPSPWPSP